MQLSQHPGENSDATNPSMTNTKSTSNDHAIGQALNDHIAKYQFHAASILLDSVKQASVRKMICSMRDRHGDLPLHSAIKRSAPDSLLLSLMHSNGEVVKIPSESGRSLPLHLAVMHCSSARIIVTLIRRNPSALDAVDEDGDSPRNCMRKGLDPISKDAIMKPTEYWKTLISEVKAEAEMELNEDFAKKIAGLTTKLTEAQSSLESSMFREKNLQARVDELEMLLKNNDASTNIQMLSTDLNKLECNAENAGIV